MTLEGTATKVVYQPDGVQTSYVVPFQLFGADDLTAILVDGKGSETPVTNFYLNGYGTDNVYAVFSYAFPSNVSLVLKRNTQRVHKTQYKEGGKFPAGAIEIDIDRVVAMIQEMQEDVDRAIKMNIASNEPPPFVQEIYDNVQKITDLATAAVEQARKWADLVPIPKASDVGKVLFVKDISGKPQYVLMAYSGGGGAGGAGYAEYSLAPEDTSGRVVIKLADIGHPVMPALFNPIVNILSVSPYTFCITQRSEEQFTVQIYKPHGVPGVIVSEFVEMGDEIMMGDNVQCGQPGNGSNVELLVSIPLPPQSV
jgi:hypothetical protein